MSVLPITIALPVISKTAVNKIESFFSSNRVYNSKLKIEMEKSTVDKEDIKEYIEILLDQFKNASDEVKYKIKRLKFDTQDSLGFSFENKTNSGKYNMTLIAGKKDKENNKYQIFLFYYDRTCEYTSISTLLRWLFGVSSQIQSIFTEDNVKSFLVYKLAKYAQDFDQNIRIVFTESTSNGSTSLNAIEN